MKKISFMGFALLSLMGTCMTGCSSDDSLSGENNNGAGVTIKASIDEPTSRVAFSKENDKLKMYWKDAADVEKFSLHYTGASNNNYLFTKAATTSSAKSASFTCSTAPNVAESTTVYAVYPGVAANAADATTIEFILKDQPGTEATTTSTGDVGDFNFMVAQATVPAGGVSDVSFSFVHKVALVQMELTFPSDVSGNITNISINSAAMHYAGTYTLSTGEWTYTEAQKGSVSTKSDASFTLANNKVTAWLAVFPEALTGITITATAGSDTYSVNMGDVTFDASNVYTVSNKTMTKVVQNSKSAYTAADYYQWDAVGSVNSSNNNSYNSNNTATNSCKDCPTYDQICMYLGAGVYWDDGTSGENQQTYTANGTYHSGLWMKKKQYIANFDDNSATKVTSATYKGGRPSSTEIYQYFFLPAAGSFYNNHIGDARTNGAYWSSTSYGTEKVWALFFSSSDAHVDSTNKELFFLPMVAE